MSRLRDAVSFAYLRISLGVFDAYEGSGLISIILSSPFTKLALNTSEKLRLIFTLIIIETL